MNIIKLIAIISNISKTDWLLRLDDFKYTNNAIDWYWW